MLTGLGLVPRHFRLDTKNFRISLYRQPIGNLGHIYSTLVGIRNLPQGNRFLEMHCAIAVYPPTRQYILVIICTCSEAVYLY